MRALTISSTEHVRQRLDQWFERQGLRAKVVGEFEDSVLLAAFGRSGIGAFPASRWSHEELLKDPGLQLLGDSRSWSNTSF
jgi:LysR family transcriptional activator of nhaA